MKVLLIFCLLSYSYSFRKSLRLAETSIIRSNCQPILTVPTKPCPSLTHLHISLISPGTVTPPLPCVPVPMPYQWKLLESGKLVQSKLCLCFREKIRQIDSFPHCLALAFSREDLSWREITEAVPNRLGSGLKWKKSECSGGSAGSRCLSWSLFHLAA